MNELITVAANEPLRPIRAGIWKRVIASGERLNVDEIFFETGIETDDHGHNLDQVAYLVAGSFEIFLDGATEVLGPGDGYSIPSNTPHRVRCIQKGSYVLVTAQAAADVHDDHHGHPDHAH